MLVEDVDHATANQVNTLYTLSLKGRDRLLNAVLGLFVIIVKTYDQIPVGKIR